MDNTSNTKVGLAHKTNKLLAVRLVGNEVFFHIHWKGGKAHEPLNTVFSHLIDRLLVTNAVLNIHSLHTCTGF